VINIQKTYKQTKNVLIDRKQKVARPKGKKHISTTFFFRKLAKRNLVQKAKQEKSQTYQYQIMKHIILCLSHRCAKHKKTFIKISFLSLFEEKFCLLTILMA
jgi:hypothetical protein